jgi:hypothetical protein
MDPLAQTVPPFLYLFSQQEVTFRIEEWANTEQQETSD